MVQRPDDTSAVSDQVLAELSRTVLVIGELLDGVFENYPDFDGWVLENLPLRPHTAERIRAMYRVWTDKPDCPELPEPWKALWALD